MRFGERLIILMISYLFIGTTLKAQQIPQTKDSLSAKVSSNKNTETKDTEPSEIDIIHGGDFVKNQKKYPNATIFINDGRQVEFNHEGVKVWCDFALLYKQQNIIKATGHVRLTQGDTIRMTSKYIEYNGNNRKALARQKVMLTTQTAILTTDTLRYDRVKQQAYYDYYGTLKDSINTLKSKEGIYYLNKKKVVFTKDVKLVNPDFVMTSQSLFYYPNTKNVYFYGPTTVANERYTSYSERGFYDTEGKQGYFLRNSKINYDNRLIYGDSIYYNDVNKFAALTNNIKVIDTINKGIIHGHYAEVYNTKDSIIITKRAVAITLQDKDSLYIHGDTLTMTGKEKHRRIKIYHDVRILGKNMSGISDSLYSSEENGIIKMLKDPVLWYGNNQISGDEVQLVFDKDTEKLDSLRILNSTFLISKDSVHKNSYNQMKGKDLFGKFENGKLSTVDIVKNGEVIYYIYNKDKLSSINKTTSNIINIVFNDSTDVEKITFLENPKGTIYPEFELPFNARKLKDFKWRGKERIKTKKDLFDKADNNIQLPVIKGIDSIDIDEREREFNRQIHTRQIRRQLQDSITRLQTPDTLVSPIDTPPQKLIKENEDINLNKDVYKMNENSSSLDSLYQFSDSLPLPPEAIKKADSIASKKLIDSIISSPISKDTILPKINQKPKITRKQKRRQRRKKNENKTQENLKKSSALPIKETNIPSQENSLDISDTQETTFDPSP